MTGTMSARTAAALCAPSTPSSTVRLCALCSLISVSITLESQVAISLYYSRKPGFELSLLRSKHEDSFSAVFTINTFFYCQVARLFITLQKITLESQVSNSFITLEGQVSNSTYHVRDTRTAAALCAPSTPSSTARSRALYVLLSSWSPTALTSLQRVAHVGGGRSMCVRGTQALSAPSMPSCTVRFGALYFLLSNVRFRTLYV